MAKSTNIIRILKVPIKAYNKQRPVSDLLWTQVEHLAAVIKTMVDDERQAVNTEEQASAFIKKYTAFLHQQEVSKTAMHSSRKEAKRHPRSPKISKKKPPHSPKR